MRFQLKAFLLLVLVPMGCSSGCSSPEKVAPPFQAPGPGLIYSFPADGQLDVPLHSRITLSFSEAVEESELARPCTAPSAGALCVLRGSSPVAGSWSLVGSGSQSAEFIADQAFEPGADYEVFVPSTMLKAGVGNLPASGPAVRFVTTRGGNRVGVAASIIAINGDPAAAYEEGSALHPRFPVTDFSTFRWVFSEEIDERSAILGEGVQFVEAGTGASVSGQLLVQGLHMSFDPDEDLDASKSYELRISPSLLDAGGESAQPQRFVFQPQSSGTSYAQVLDVSPGVGDADFPSESTVSSLARNNVLVSSPIIGDKLIQLRDGQIELEMAQVDLFPEAVPVVIRKGQSLVASGLKVELAGTVNAGLDTGDLRLSFVSDVTGYMVRNTHWPASTIPDNQEAPLEVFLNFDIGVSATDGVGNAVLTQNNLGVQASGVVEVHDGSLIITNLGSIELDLLGISKAPAQMALSLATATGLSAPSDTDAPLLRSAYPSADQPLLELGDSILLGFTEAIELDGANAVELRNEFGSLVEADMRASGSMVVISPTEPLAGDVDYAVFINAGLRDLSGNSWLRQGQDPTGGEGVLRFSTTSLASADALPPSVLAIYPGAPCALVGEGSGQRCCVGGDGADSEYLPSDLPANHKIEVLFDKAMSPGSITLGTACGQGSFRVEQVTGTSCDAAVPGLIHLSERGIQFVPEDPWQEGVSYRLRIIAGNNSSCGAGEVCGLNNLALNTDPLDGNGNGGGPDVQAFFRGAKASTGAVAVAGAQPIVDRNGNGKVDASESESTTNRAAVALAGVSGIVTSASIAMPDCDTATPDNEGCLYLSSDLVVVLGENQTSCVIESAEGNLNAADCLPVSVSPGAIYGTELSMDANVLGLGIINDLKTGRVILRIREGDQQVKGYIVEDAAGEPEILLTLSVYMDAPDLSILGGLASHDLHSKELRVFLRGPVDFREDGRLKISVANVEDVHIDVGISALGLNTGTMSLAIAAGAMKLDLVSRAARGGLR